MIPNAATALFGTVADPIGHVTSCERFNPLFAKWRFNGLMIVYHVAPKGLNAFLDGVRGTHNLKGFCVTIPHKKAVAPLLDRLSERAARVGAVNVVRREQDGSLTGEQMDGTGFVTGLLNARHVVQGRSIYMAGAGGAATGIAFELAAVGAKEIAIYNRTRMSAEALAKRIMQAYPHCRVRLADRTPTECDIAINATNVGMNAGDPLPFDVTGLRKSALVAEVIMRPHVTALLEHAANRGCPIHYGDAMLLSQLPMLARFMGARDERPTSQQEY